MRHCVKQCKLSKDGLYCIGCLRTIEEIKKAGSKKKDDRPEFTLWLLNLPPINLLNIDLVYQWSR